VIPVIFTGPLGLSIVPTAAAASKGLTTTAPGLALALAKGIINILLLFCGPLYF